MKAGPFAGSLILLLVLPLFATPSANTVSAQTSTEPNVFVGIDVAFDNITATKELADAMQPYTNLFIIGCTYGISRENTSRLNDLFDLCQYLYNKDYYFMIFQNVAPISEVVEYVRQFGDRFLGFYAYDELGGRQLDQASNSVYFSSADNYTAAARYFEGKVNGWLYNTSATPLYMGFCTNFDSRNEFKLFTSDYALYWFDYKGGYDTVFAEFAGNYSRQLNVALCRGAATAQNKDWGTMITWKHTEAPYMESSSELYDDMKLAYDNGAKYIVVFDSNENYTESTLTPQHLDAIKQFWQYMQDNPQDPEADNKRIAYVLPDGYAYGFRGPEDRIWGIWGADMTSYMISISVNIMLEKYGSNLDIIYDDNLQSLNTSAYSMLIYWNDPAAVSEMWPPDWPIASTTPTSNSTSGNDLNGLNQLIFISVGVMVVAVIAAAGWTQRKRFTTQTQHKKLES